MNTLNFTFNFNAPVGQNIAHVDTLEAHFDKEMTMQVIDGEDIALGRANPAPTFALGRANPAPTLPEERLARAVEAVQSFFWAQSSWAVVYCVCRDHLGVADSMSEFERRVAGLPFTKRVVECPAGTVRKAFINNDYLRYPVTRWPEGRARLLAEKLMGEMKNEMEG